MRLCDLRKLLVSGGLVVVLTLAVQAASPKDAAMVKDIAVTSSGQALEARITSTGTARFTYFELKRPRRLVVDFHGLQNGIGYVAGPAVLVPEAQTSAALTRASLVSLSTIQEIPAASPAVALLQPQVISQPLAAAVVAAPSPSLSLTLTPAPAPTPVQATGQITTGTPSTVPVIITPPTAQTFNGELVSIDLKDTDIKDFFRLIGDISGLNIFLDDNVNGNLTITLKELPWDQALDIVLKNKNLGGVIQGNVLRIATQQTLGAEQAARNTALNAAANSVPLVNHQYVMNYTKAIDVEKVLKASGVLSSKGTVVAEPRRNALIVYDYEDQFENISRMVSFIDVAAQQVEIEARLLTANKSFSQEFGSQLGMIFGNNSGNILTGGSGASSPFSRTPPPRATVGGSSGIPLVSNLPAAATSGIAFLMQPGGDILLDSIITAAEARGTAKLMSRPHVVTQNNVAAEISQGTQIPVQTNVNNTISVSFLTFALKLSVTPQITEAGTILMTVEIENSQPDFARSVNGVPSVSTQAAKTTTLVPDGTTMMIGGIFVDTDSLNIRQVPGLGSLPLIGHMFKNTSTIKSTAELLFFITPRIRALEPVVAAPVAN